MVSVLYVIMLYMPGMQGRKHSEESKKRMSESRKKHYETNPNAKDHLLGNKNFEGKKHSAEAKEKIRKSQTGSSNSMYGKRNEESPHWKGDDVGYYGIHDWLTANYGQPIGCENCGTTDKSKRYEWAAINGEHRRSRDQYMRLCKKCHNDYDGVNVWQQTSK